MKKSKQTSQDKFQIFCDKMYLVRFQASYFMFFFGEFGGIVLISLHFTTMWLFKNIRSPEKSKNCLPLYIIGVEIYVRLRKSNFIKRIGTNVKYNVHKYGNLVCHLDSMWTNNETSGKKNIFQPSEFEIFAFICGIER